MEQYQIKEIGIEESVGWDFIDFVKNRESIEYYNSTDDWSLEKKNSGVAVKWSEPIEECEYVFYIDKERE